jgi:hypothetical protein
MLLLVLGMALAKHLHGMVRTSAPALVQKIPA